MCSRGFVSLVAVAGLALSPTTAVAAPEPVPDYSEVITTLRSDIKAAMVSNGVVGLTIALVDGDRVVWKRGFGYADRKRQKRVTSETLFHIGSVSKTAASIAVMQLVEQGRVDLDKPLAKYVSGFSLLPRYKGNVITVRSVLDHHSGIPGDVFNGMLTVGEPDPDFRKWLKRALAKMYPERRVDTVYAYNNSGFVLLQDLVENVTGMPFNEYSQRYLFKPAGMASSTFKTTAAPANRLMRNYQVEFAPDGSIDKVTKQPREYINGWTAGSITASATDMADYMQMLLAGGMGEDGRVLRKSTLQQMWTRQVHTPLDISFTHYGLGFAVGDAGLGWAGKVIWHDGATVWNHTMLKLLPGSDLGVFVSVNTSAGGGVPSTIADEALTLAYSAKTGKQPPELVIPQSPVVPAAGLGELSGYYAGTSSLYGVAVTDTGLMLSANAGTDDPRNTPMLPHADGWFRPEGASLPMVRFRTIEGRKLMLMRLELSGALTTLIAGEKLPATTITSDWSARLGRYRAVNANPNVDPRLVAREIVMRDFQGLLLMELDSEGGIQPLAVRQDEVAFTAGLGFGLGRGKGECVIPGEAAAGVPTFTYLGVKYRRVG